MRLSSGHFLLAGCLLVILLLVGMLFVLFEERADLRRLVSEFEVDRSVPQANDRDNYVDKPSKGKLNIAQRIMKLIKADEGIRRSPYLDSRKNPTLGIGRNLKGNGVSVAEYDQIVSAETYEHVVRHAEVRNGRIYASTLESARQLFPEPLSDASIELLFQDDVDGAVRAAQNLFPEWQSLDPGRQAAIIDLIYNLGLPHFKGFTEMIKAIRNRDWDRAAKELLLSKAARENIGRYHRIAYILQTGGDMN